MKVQLYKVNNSPNELNKTLDSALEVNCNLKDVYSLMNPTITLTFNEEFLSYNYCYMENFKRYYFITNFSIINNNILKVELHEDVLMTFKDGILASVGDLEIDLKDNFESYKYEKSYTRNIETIDFDNPFNVDGNLVLIATSGGER